MTKVLVVLSGLIIGEFLLFFGVAHTNFLNPSLKARSFSAPQPVQPALEFTAPTQMVYFPRTGQFSSQDQNQVVTLASLTKLATAITALKEGAASRTFTAGAGLPSIPHVIGLKNGRAITGQQLLQAALIPSANDAATLLGEGSFEKAESLVHSFGLSSVILKEPSGLNPENVASVKDITLLSALAQTNPLISAAIKEKTFSYLGNNFPSTNELLDQGYIGIKTGSLPESGFHFIGLKQLPEPVIIATLGTKSSEQRFLLTDALAREIARDLQN